MGNMSSLPLEKACLFFRCSVFSLTFTIFKLKEYRNFQTHLSLKSREPFNTPR